MAAAITHQCRAPCPRATSRPAKPVDVGTPRKSAALPTLQDKRLVLRPLLALEGAEAGAVGLVVEELLHALGAAVLLVDEAQGVALGVEIVGGLRLIHEAHRAQRLLGVAQHCGRLLL